jgi:hypothetical protein
MLAANRSISFIISLRTAGNFSPQRHEDTKKDRRSADFADLKFKKSASSAKSADNSRHGCVFAGHGAGRPHGLHPKGRPEVRADGSGGIHQKQKSRASIQARLRISEIYSESLYRICL